MSDSVAAWRAAAEAGDARAAAAALAADVELVSPLTDRFVFRGRDELEELLTSVFEIFTGIRFSAEHRDGDRVALFAAGRVGALRLEEAQQLELDAEGRIRRLSIAMRPLPALTAFQRALGPRVARRQGRPGVARLLSAAGAFLDSVASSGDRVFLPLASPERSRRTGP